MWKQKIGISVGNEYKIPTKEVVKMLGEIGFDAVSPEWKENEDLSEIISTARENGMEIQSLHAPFTKAANMWSSDEKVSKAVKDELFKALEDCRHFNIPVMVVHTWIGFDYEFGEVKYGFENYGDIVERADEYGVKIAFENTEGEEYLFALMEYFKENDTVGFCWDSGHEMCYNYSKDFIEKFGNKLLITHLNDNLGIKSFEGKITWIDDLHLLPYDGIADWDFNIARLKKAKHLDILNFELNIHSKPGRHENDIYAQMNLEQYFTEAYKRACRIAYRYAV
ncbi:MAG: sugar phosphate isomerase/epimerase family protein [Clostridia bacterium]|nr:sugar phosphate isomerase/epimerase family protein [Clostridia bacterium]